MYVAIGMLSTFIAPPIAYEERNPYLSSYFSVAPVGDLGAPNFLPYAALD